MRHKRQPNFRRRLLVLGLAFCLLACLGAPALAAESDTEAPYQSYTYWDTFAGEQKPAYGRAVYEPAFAIDAAYLGQETLGGLTDLCTDENGNVYILDGARSDVYLLDPAYRLLRVLHGFTDGAQTVTFAEAQGIYVRDNEIYLCDTKGGRILVADPEGKLTRTITAPSSPLIPATFQFRPIRLAMDANRYLYILCDGSYYGALLCSNTGEFLNFYGANLTEGGVLAAVANLWKKLTMTNEKRSKTASSIPYQFRDLYIDADDFVYTATGSSVKTDQLRKLSPGGEDVLYRTGLRYADQTDTYFYTEDTVIDRRLDTSNLAVDPQGYVYLLDTTYGRIFLYDSESRLLSAFGGGIGYGDRLGTFRIANAIDLKGDDVLVSDSVKNTVTVFRVTPFGAALKTARRMTIEGRYTESKALWTDLLAQDRNCQLAYVGLAKSAYAEKDYAAALRYAKLGNERGVYSQAFRSYRNDFVRSHFNWLALALVLLISGVAALVVLRKRRPARAANVQLAAARSVLAHPFDGFAAIKQKQLASLPIALALSVLFYVTRVMETNFGGFLFTHVSDSDANAFFLLLRTFGFIALWTFSNVLVTQLMGGLGKPKEILCTVCYSLTPLILYSAVYVVLSNLMVAEEGAFLGIFSGLAIAWTFVLLLVGHMAIHDFGFVKTLVSFLLTVLAMAIIVFFLFIFVVLVQQLAGFLGTIGAEILHY